MNVIVWIHLIDAVIMAKGCSNEIGIAVGVIIIVLVVRKTKNLGWEGGGGSGGQ